MNPALRIAFWAVVAASLLANAVVLGLFLRFGELRGVIKGGGGFTNLPAPIKQEFRTVLRENPQAYRKLLRELADARSAMFDAGAARPYEHAAVQAAMERVRAASADLQMAGQALLLQAFDNVAAQ